MWDGAPWGTRRADMALTRISCWRDSPHGSWFQMCALDPEPRSCWECTRGTVLRLPGVGDIVDCPPANWKWQSCATRLLDTIERPRRSSLGAGRDGHE